MSIIHFINSHIDKPAMVDSGLTEDMIRLSVGLEDFEYIKLDFEKGFRSIKNYKSWD